MNRNEVTVALSAAIGLTALPSIAAASPTSQLLYSRGPGAESCPSEAALRSAVAARVGYDPFFPWAKRTVVARMRANGTGFEESVSLVDENGLEHGAREIHTSGRCSELLEVTALEIAIAIDPQALAPPVAKRPTTPAQPGPAEETTPTSPPSLAPETDHVPPAAARSTPANETTSSAQAPARSSAFLEGGLLAAAGYGPSVVAGLALGAGWRWSRASVRLEGRVDAPSVHRFAEGGGWVSAWLAAGSVVACAHQDVLYLCAVGQLGALLSRSNVVAAGAAALWTAAGARFGTSIPLSPTLALSMGSDILAVPSPVRLELNHGDAWVGPVVAASLATGLEVRF